MLLLFTVDAGASQFEVVQCEHISDYRATGHFESAIFA